MLLILDDCEKGFYSIGTPRKSSDTPPNVGLYINVEGRVAPTEMIVRAEKADKK
jgi:hypothetical protein